MNITLKFLFAVGAAVALPAVLNAATAQENWTKDCQKCHAADGSASGPMGKKLKLKNYSDPAVQAAMTDEDIGAAIKNGVKDEATGKMTMPAYGEKYSAEDVAGLLALVRSFAAK